MKDILRKIFQTKEDSKEKKITSAPLVQTTPLTDDQIQGSQGESIYPRPQQFVIGCGQSVGLQRDHNEDTLFAMSSILADGLSDIPFGLCIVADGMGGHQNGEIASSVAVRISSKILINKIYSHLLEINPDPMEESLQETIEKAVGEVQKAVVRYAPGGGTTLTLALMLGEQVTIAHVGDSRAYFVFPDGRIQKLTKDHSLVQRMIDLEELTEQEAKEHPQRNVLIKAIGQSDPIRADLQTHQIPKSGYLLLCSDGLWGVVDETDLYRMVCSESDPSLACKKMIEAANNNGGPDNISVVLVKFVGQ